MPSFEHKKEKVVMAILQAVGNTETPGSTEVTVIAKDDNGDVVRAKGTTVPSDAETGYSKGAIFIDTNVATGTSGFYENIGTNTSCNFDVVGSTLPAGAVGADELATNAVTNVKMATDAVDTDEIATGAVESDEIEDATIEEVDLSANLKKELLTLGLMGTVAAFGFPFNATVDTEQTAALAKVDDGGVFANLAVAGGEAGFASNYQLWPDTELENDAVYFGGAAPFGVLTLDNGTNATYGADSVQWEYYNGSSWASLTIVYDETDTNNQSGTRPFMQDGQIIFSAPTDWASTSVDGQAAFWVRARIISGFNVTQIPIFNSVEHKLVTSPTASESPYAGTLSRARLSFVTPSGANNDTVFILCNLTSGACSALTTLTKALAANEVANFALLVAAGDQLAIYITVEDGTTEFANGLMEVLCTRS